MANAFLNLISQIAAYGDVVQSNNPDLRYVDWTKRVLNVPVKNPKAEAFSIDPLSSFMVFNGQRSTAIDGTTEFLLSLSTVPGSTNRYRFTWDGTGTAPAFRTDRGLTLNTRTITITVLANATVTFASSSAGDFAAVVVGDVLFIPGTTTGDTSGPFNPNNEGEWTVLSKDVGNQTLTLSRPFGTSFAAFGQAVAVTANSQVLAYSATGVLVGDKVTVSAGFPASVQGTYDVIHVRPGLFEVYATQPLPTNITAVPTATGMVFYTMGKRYIRVEGDQRFLVRANGSTDSSEPVEPWAAGDPLQTGEYSKSGPMWQLVIVNLSTASLNIVVISVE